LEQNVHAKEVTGAMGKFMLH